MSKISAAELDIALKLLRENTSISVVSKYLRYNDLASSAGSWEALINNRIRPALKAGHLDRNDIVKLLRNVEEHGQQHILLYKLPQHVAQQLMNEERVKAALNKYDLVALFENPKIVDLPNGQILVDVRIYKGNRQRELVIKSVDGRVYRRLLSRKTEGNYETLVYENYRQRAVNIMRVLEDGSVEVRIQSHRRVIDYAQEADTLIEMCIPLVQKLQLQSVPVLTAKMYFAKKPSELRGRVRFGNGKFMNRKGGGMTISTGHEQQDLYDDEGAVEGTAAYMKRNDGYCEEASIYWKPKVENSLPSTELHTFFAGAVNEFALTGQCDAADYEYVLEQIKKANRKH
ncbi:hypothetical protein [Edaphobacter flagellatus]|uniref:hypothetical protein n=1 Tax=Edaphobacter flagellatus TaxID=1933044 RepID=UPI0021B4A50B|nr:hypothetical protein [Edaphobacter flagellatus]